MLDHVGTGVTDVAAGKASYLAALRPLAVRWR